MNETTEPTREEVIALLEPLIARAESEGKWLRHTYYGDDVCMSPKEFRASIAEGRFIHGPVNWELIDPKSLLVDIDKEVEKMKLHNERIWDRIVG